MIKSRVARPTRDLARSIEFYRDRLGLTHTGGFRDHAGYDGAFFALPGGGELELTAGPMPPVTWSDEDLLVLYVADRAVLQQWSDAMAAHGIASVEPANPYWSRMGHTVLDPDGYRVVIAVPAGVDGPTRIEQHDGNRADLRNLFELAEDSAEQLDRYIELGEVLIARRGDAIVGHLQLVPTGGEGEIELKNMAVAEDFQGLGIGRTLIDAATRRAGQQGFSRMVVATAAADTGNLRFYQRAGFRMTSIEADAFTPETGYPDAIVIDGIELRDRVWLALMLTPVRDQQ
jgi:ribosomal protein S18 acetylase RimI-like enzyme